MEIRDLTAEEVVAVGKGQRALRDVLGIPEALLIQGALLGRDAWLAGDLRTAEILAEGLIAVDPRYAYGHSLLASVRLREGRLDEALEAARSALGLAGDDRELQRATTALIGRIETTLKKMEV